MAGKPQTLATTSAFEILGPVMVGPSSSHTAGALRCAQVAASLLEGRITKVTFGLWNSFAHTYRGHGTDRALVAGILGLDTDDENIKQAFDLAREQGLEYHFDIKGDDASIHPNTVDIDMVDDTGATAGYPLICGPSYEPALTATATAAAGLRGVAVDVARDQPRCCHLCPQGIAPEGTNPPPARATGEGRRWASAPDVWAGKPRQPPSDKGSPGRTTEQGCRDD